MEKRCNKCGIVKELEKDFPQKCKNKAGVQRYHGICKRCVLDRKIARRKERRDQWILDNPPISQEQKRLMQSLTNKAHRQRNRSWLNEYKKTLTCQHCPIEFKDTPWLCDFHHVDSSLKRFELSKLNTQSLSLIQEEVAKCIPLCANCHRTLHHLEKVNV